MNYRLGMALLGLGVLFVPGSCGGGSGGGSSSDMVINLGSNGFGNLLPYTVFRADAEGFPTTELIEIRRMQDLIDNVNLSNPVLPVAQWPTAAVLPDGEPGNHFIYVQFRQPIEIGSVLDASPAGAEFSNLIGTITLVSLDPVTGQTSTIRGKAFIGGKAYGGIDPEDPTQLRLEQWVTIIGGRPVANLDVDGDGVDDFAEGEQPGLGFPGTQGDSAFAGALDLIDERTFVFIPDQDGDLRTHETFPSGVQIRMQMTSGVTAVNGNVLEEEGTASSSVGSDTIGAEVRVSGISQIPVIIPGNGDVDVDPETRITVEFTEPVQIPTIGDLPTDSPPGASASIQITFGPPASTVSVPFTAEPKSVFDLSSLILTPIYAFPGSGPEFASCGVFNQVTVQVTAGQFQDLAGNQNTLSPQTFFTTGEGPGLINAPITPDALYIARVQAESAISVLDLNGFGASTGVPTFNPACPIVQGNTNYPNNPNVLLQGSALIPPLTPGACTFDGGSSGPFTLTLDSSLDDRLVRSPILDSVGEMMLGHAMDNVFNNGAPFGCQAGGGNLCANTGLKVISVAAGGPGTLAPSSVTTFPIKTEFGAENLVSWAPHPNPPPLAFPPLCLSPIIGGQEPTSIDTVVVNLLTPGPINQGFPESCIPPQDLLTIEQNAFFVGPSPPAPDITQCTQFAARQQIGQFFYVLDRVASEVVVLNSNRMAVLDRIPLPDPTSMAMGPDLDFLAVTNENANLVSFISIDPTSSTFHQVVKQVVVGEGPTGIAWETGNEDLIVCNTGANTLSIISAFSLEVRKTLLSQLSQPFEVVTTPRMVPGIAFSRQVYFAYILNRNGKVSLFESGPDGVNGWGFDDVIGQPEFVFENPKAIQPDVNNAAVGSGVWIAHETPLSILDGLPTGQTGGALSNLFIESTLPGLIPLDPGFFVNPQIRELEFRLRASIGEGDNGLTGIPIDLAFDDLRNVTALTNFSTAFSPSFPLSINGKSLVKPTGGAFVPVTTPQFLFCAVPNSSEGPGVLDVINLEGGFLRFDTNPYDAGIQSIPVPGVRRLSNFIRQ